jgi:SAM-dependent methyltransferase
VPAGLIGKLSDNASNRTDPAPRVGRVTDNYATGTRAAYGAIATQYASTWDRTPASILTELDWLAAQLPAGARIADLGCGPGHHTRLLRERGLRVSGFDLSYEMLASVGTPGVVQADMLALPIADGSFDAVWSVAALLHIPRPVVPVALAEFARVLRPGGRLMLIVAEGDGEGWEIVPYDVPDREEAQRWYVLHRLDALSSLLDAAGFDVENHWRRAARRQWLHIHARLR